MGKTLAQARKAAGLTQFQLAAAAKVSLATISNIESCRQAPTVATAIKIARACGLTANDIEWPDPETVKPRRPKEDAAA